MHAGTFSLAILKLDGMGREGRRKGSLYIAMIKPSAGDFSVKL